MSRRVLVVGVGALGSWGAGTEALGRALATGTPRLAPLGDPSTLLDNRRSPSKPAPLPLHPRVRRAALVDPADLADWLPAREARRMSPPSRFTVAAARMALEAAGIDPAAEEPGASELWERAAVFMATSFGPSSITEEMLEQILLDGPEAASPAAFAESVANAPAAQLARWTGARGPNLTLTAREAGPLLALGRAGAEIAAGRSDLALAGAVDEVTATLQAIYDRARALARGRFRAGAWTDPVARPFDRRRAGILLAEGAAVAVLASEEALAGRPARPRAALVAAGSAFDPTSCRNGWGHPEMGGQILGEALRSFLERSEVAPESIDLLVASAAGSILGDALEARTLASAWSGAEPPPIMAPKAVTGELAGGHLAAALLALGPGPVDWPAPWAEAPDPALGLSVHRGAPLTPRRVLATAVSAGGSASWAVLDRVGPDTTGAGA